MAPVTAPINRLVVSLESKIFKVSPAAFYRPSESISNTVRNNARPPDSPIPSWNQSIGTCCVVLDEPGPQIRLHTKKTIQAKYYTQRHKSNPSHHALLLAAVPAHSATRLLRRLLARALPEWAPWTYVAMYNTDCLSQITIHDGTSGLMDSKKVDYAQIFNIAG